MSQGLTADKAFEHFDRSGVGAVDQDEFLEGLDKLHITLTPAECKQVRERGREGGREGQHGSLGTTATATGVWS